MIVLRSKEFSSKAQKALRKKYYRGVSDPLDAADIIYEIDKGTKKTAKKTGKDINMLQRKVFDKNRPLDASVIRNSRRDDAINNAIFHRDRLQEKTTNEGMQSYRKKLMENAKENRMRKRKQKVADSISHHKIQADALRAKKLAGQKLAKNLKTAGKIGLGAAALVGGGVVAKKMYDKKKKKDSAEENN